MACAFCTNACRRAKLDETLAKFLGNFARWLVLTAVVITCLSSFGVQVTSLVAILGSVGVAIGLALQGSLSHIASGVMLLIFRPFKVGDFVTAGGQTGIVFFLAILFTFLLLASLYSNYALQRDVRNLVAVPDPKPGDKLLAPVAGPRGGMAPRGAPAPAQAALGDGFDDLRWLHLGEHLMQ